MPNNLEELDAAIDEQDAMAQQAVQGGLAGAIPPATEPLDGATLNALADIIERAVPELSGGEAAPVQLQRVQGQVGQVPPDIGAQILTAAAFIDQFPAAGKYKFDPVALMSSNQGIGQIGSIIGQMARDQQLLAAVRGGGAPAPDEAEELPVETTMEE